MALKTLLLRSKLDAKKKNLEALREKDADFEKREAEIEAAINEMTEDTSEEDRNEIEKQAEDFQKEKEEHEQQKEGLEKEISGIEEEIKKEEAKAPAPEQEKERKDGKIMVNRTKFFGMDLQERNTFFADEKVKEFLVEVRTCMKEKRALQNSGLVIPEIALPLIKQIAKENSKLLKYVLVRQVSGTTRQNIMGEIPEAYWDEMCAALKELDLTFHNMEMDGYKVSGFFAVCNAVLEDNDVNLATELFTAIGKAIGKAIDKAILYGKGVKMPLGIVPALLRTTAPEGYPTTGRAWDDLSKTHVITGTAKTGIALFQEIVKKSGVVDNDYDTSTMVWCMNKQTHSTLIAESLGTNAAAAIVAGMNNAMPVIGGNVEEFKYIPDGVIIFGYFGNYILAERAGTHLSQSEHVKFLEDQTVFKGTARYDGKPAIREAFAVFGIGAAPDTTSPKFAGETTTE